MNWKQTDNFTSSDKRLHSKILLQMVVQSLQLLPGEEQQEHKYQINAELENAQVSHFRWNLLLTDSYVGTLITAMPMMKFLDVSLKDMIVSKLVNSMEKMKKLKITVTVGCHC